MNMRINLKEMLRRQAVLPKHLIGLLQNASNVGPGYCSSNPQSFVGGSCECNRC